MAELYKKYRGEEADCVFTGTMEECKKAEAMLVEYYKNCYYSEPVVYIGTPVERGSEQSYIASCMSGELVYGS